MSVKIPESLTVESFFTNHAAALKIRLVAGASGLNRLIREGAVNRPGLALAGFYQHFAERRIQLLGRHELAYLESLNVRELRAILRTFLKTPIPCIIVARDIKPPRALTELAEKYSVPVFRTPLSTMRLSNLATICLENDFAPVATEHGSMVDIQGVGVMLRGQSGVGKSEAVLSLMERGYSLVSDDICKIRLVESRELVVTSPDLTRFHMEVRGLGIINLVSIFGVGAIRLEKRLDLVVTLQHWDSGEEIDRTGLDSTTYEILGISVAHVIIPVRPGRDLARLIEVAALDAKLKQMGQNTAIEFNKKLISIMSKKETKEETKLKKSG
jgi:HPr kinase/phosphorylase